MKYLILVRHGEYDGCCHLTNNGRKQVKDLTKKLKRFIHHGSSLAILTSTAPRATESAEIIGSIFKTNYKQYELLWSEQFQPPDMKGTLKLVRSEEKHCDVLILVTHYEYVIDFPIFFANTVLKVEFRPIDIKKGEALIIDCQQKTITRIQ